MSNPSSPSSSPPTAPRRLALDALHRELGARMGPFAGYDMPIQYPDGLKAEHLHTRQAAGLFDVSHMGQLSVSGPGLWAALEAALPLDSDGWTVGQQKYSMLLNERGGIEDDLMVINLGDEARIIVNAGNRDADRALLAARCPGLRIEWIDAALIALQGPAAEAALARLDPSATELHFMGSATLNLLGHQCLATRSGYTGEDGFEISIPTAGAEAVVRELLRDPSVRPVGLGARDTLRLEAGLPLHGNDIDPGTTPIEAGLTFAIPRSRRAGGAKAGGFPGAKTVLRQIVSGAPRKLVGLISDESVPIRAHSEIQTEAGTRIGEVTSGTVSPSLGKPIMLAYLDSAALSSEKVDDPLRAVVRDRRPVVRLYALPFVTKRYKR